MKQAEIDFCERWVGLRGPDGCVLWARADDDSPPFHGGYGTRYTIFTTPRGDRALDLIPPGADLVASYESALAQGLEIVADDAFDLDAEIDELSRDLDQRNLVDCPACRATGRVELSKLDGRDRTIVDLVEGVDARADSTGKTAIDVLPGWDVTCPTCKGARRIEATSGDDLIRVDTRRIEAPTEPSAWLPWSPETARLVKVGDVIEARLDPSHPSRGGSSTPPSPVITESWTLRNTAWEIRIVSRAAEPRRLEWRQLTRDVAEGLVGQTFEARICPAYPTLVQKTVSVGTLVLYTDTHRLPLDGSWWVRPLAPEKGPRIPTLAESIAWAKSDIVEPGWTRLGDLSLEQRQALVGKTIEWTDQMLSGTGSVENVTDRGFIMCSHEVYPGWQLSMPGTEIRVVDG